jgi:hypothetical protein
MAEKSDAVKTGHYSYYADKVLVLGKDGINMASTTNPLPVDAIVTVDSMDVYAEMKTTTGADFYVTTTNVGDDTDTISFDSVAANVVGGTLKLGMIQAIENKTQGCIYNTAGATVTNTSIVLDMTKQETGAPVPGATDEFEIVYRGIDRLGLIEDKDFATETTLALIEGKDFATETTLALIEGKITDCDTGNVTVVGQPALTYTTDSVTVHQGGIWSVTISGSAATTATNTKVSVGSSSTSVLALNASRKFAIFVNDSDETIYLNLSGTAVMNEGIRLNANGGSYEINLNNLYTGAVTGICSSGTKNLTVVEG